MTGDLSGWAARRSAQIAPTFESVQPRLYGLPVPRPHLTRETPDRAIAITRQYRSRSSSW
jgi:hypothetical protein